MKRSDGSAWSSSAAPRGVRVQRRRTAGCGDSDCIRTARVAFALCACASTTGGRRRPQLPGPVRGPRISCGREKPGRVNCESRVGVPQRCQGRFLCPIISVLRDYWQMKTRVVAHTYSCLTGSEHQPLFLAGAAREAPGGHSPQIFSIYSHFVL